MTNFHKASTVILLILVGVMGGYFLSTTQTEFGLPAITGNVISNTPQEINTLEKVNDSVVEIIELKNITEGIIKNEELVQNPPKTPEEYQGFIRPLEAEPFLDEMNFTGENDTWGDYKPLDTREEFEEILKFLDKLVYWKDKMLYGAEDYWATPNESLSALKGDEEDWGIALVSLMHARNSTYECYFVGNEEFSGGVICYLGETDQFYRFVNTYFDTWRGNAGIIWGNYLSIDKGDIEQDVTIQLRNFRNRFLEDTVGYCCISKFRDRRITFAFNENEYLEFEGGKDVVNWLRSFMN